MDRPFLACPSARNGSSAGCRRHRHPDQRAARPQRPRLINDERVNLKRHLEAAGDADDVHGRHMRARDSCRRGAFQRRVFWWRHCSTAGPTVTRRDLAEAEAAIERLAAASAEEGLVIRDTWLVRLRALLARAHGDDAAYAHFRDRYRDMAKTLEFDGHIAWAEAMP